MEKSLQTADQQRDKDDLGALLGSKQRPPQRTFGLRAFDGFLYPGVTNFGVFATSVFFTYLTNKGSQFGKAGTTARQFGELVEKRGVWLRDKYKKMGLSEGVADNVKMVTWSFADGSLLAPVIKGFEDRREDIAKSIDDWAGTRPDTDDAYIAEPKQTWLSVLGARALTAGIVAPTAGLLNEVNFRYAGQYNNLNHHLFTRPGIWLGNELKESASLVKKYGKSNIEEVAKATFFEAFYTSVCTAGQYYFSRLIASKTGNNENEQAQPDTSLNKVVASERLQPQTTEIAHQN